MSTILKALRRLEHDKQAEAARERNHDPLAPALTAAEPAPAQHPRRPLVSWLAVATVAAALGAGASYGLAAWWMSRNAVPGSLDVASGTPAAPAPPVAGTRSAAGAPTVSTETPTSAGAAARMLARSPEAGPQPLPPSVAVPARASGVGAPSQGGRSAPPQGGRSAPPQGGRSAPTAQELLLAGAASSAPDPWESAAHAAPPPGRSRAEAARTERVITPDEPAGASSAASRGASEAASSASSGAAAAVNTTGRPPVAARPPSRPAPTPRAAAPTPTAAARGSAGTATQAPIPSRRADAATGSLDAGIPISSLPELVLPEPSPVVTPPRPAPPQRISKAAAPTRTPAPTSSASAAPTSSAPAAPTSPTPSSAAASDSGGKLEIQVLKTVWHPKPERRSARVRLPDRVEVLEVHQDDVVEGYMVSEITPSSVVLARDEVEFTYRVGH